jgi:type IV pilus assembly protein PilX
MPSCRAIPTPRRERGAVLIVSLVILLVLTILGVAGLQNTSMEERMAGNYRDRFTAFQAAETALRAGEGQIDEITTFQVMKFDGTDGTYTVEATTGNTDPYDPTNYTRALTAVTLDGVGDAPEWYIEKLPKVPLPKSSLVVGFQGKPKDVQYYRISARGSGSSGRAEVILQSTYHR